MDFQMKKIFVIFVFYVFYVQFLASILHAKIMSVFNSKTTTFESFIATFGVNVYVNDQFQSFNPGSLFY